MAENLSIVQQIKALDEQRSKLLETAKAEALAKANEAVEDLNAMGFKYALTDLTMKPKAKAATVKREPSGGRADTVGSRPYPHMTNGHTALKRKSAPSQTPSSKNSAW